MEEALLELDAGLPGGVGARPALECAVGVKEREAPKPVTEKLPPGRSKRGSEW